MQVIFIHHSCFLVEVDEKVLIFDWFDGDRVEGYHFGGVLPEYEPDTPVYVFAIHLAFVPADPRLMEHQFDGMNYFLEHTDADYVFPMHMWQDYSALPDYRKRISNAAMAERVVEIKHENQIFEILEE